MNYAFEIALFMVINFVMFANFLDEQLFFETLLGEVL